MRLMRDVIRRFLANGAVARQLGEGERLLRNHAAVLQQRDRVAGLIEQCLQSPEWEVRNVGIKLIPVLGEPSLFPRLVERLADRAEAGIVRRNAATAIRDTQYGGDDVRRALFAALHDRYWEVRTEAVGALPSLAEPSAESEAALLALLFGKAAVDHETTPASAFRAARLRERNFEVRAACAQALGALAVSERGLAALCRLSEDSSWIVRFQATIALGELASREGRFRAAASEQMARVRLTPECSVPDHPFRETLSRLRHDISKGNGQGDTERVRSLYLDLKKGWNVVTRT